MDADDEMSVDHFLRFSLYLSEWKGSGNNND